MRSSLRQRLNRPSPWLVACLVAASLSLTVFMAGCGGTDTTATTSAGSTTLSGNDLGKAAAALWTEATQKLDTLLAGEPASDDVKDEVVALKEDYVQKLVELGRQRDSLDAAAKAEADAATTSALAAAANEDWYTTYMDLYDHYSYASGDVDFVNLLASFNILTQYADFELLKTQEPGEASRLGIQ